MDMEQWEEALKERDALQTEFNDRIKALEKKFEIDIVPLISCHDVFDRINCSHVQLTVFSGLTEYFSNKIEKKRESDLQD